MAVLDLPSIRVDGERARAFVLAQGGSRERARVEGIFGATGPDRQVVKALEGLQNPDGGFPLQQQAGAPSSVDSTCYILFQLKDMPPLAGSPMATRAVSFLRRSQQTDGSWRETPEVGEHAPFWAASGDPKAQAYLTAVATYTILTLEPEHLDPVSRAMGWLRRALVQDPTGAQYYTQTLAMSWAVFFRLAGPKASETIWAFQALGRRELDAPQLAWWLACALETGIGGRFLLPLAQELGKLAAMQQADGAWPAEEGYAVESTLTALRVFRGYGVV
jgi:hypothetical protein